MKKINKLKPTKLVILAWSLFAASPSYGGNNAAFISQSVPASMQAGAKSQVQITLKNTGTTTWSENGGVGSYRLGSQNPGNNTVWRVDNRVKLLPGETVRPSANKTFVFDVVAPNQAGRYNFQWQMVHEGVSHWFGAKSPNVTINVTQPSGVLLDIMSLNGQQLGLRQMTYQGQRFLTGGGIYLIYSKTGADIPNSNFGSEQSREGNYMANALGEIGQPFKLQFERMSASILKFSADLGPVSKTIYEANLAMDFDKSLIASWAFDGKSYREGCANDYRLRQGNSGLYTGIRSPCGNTPDVPGPVGIAATGPSPHWWRVSGSGGSVKVTINNAAARNLRDAGFTRHPYTYNIGFSFGRLDRGQSAHLDGTVEVSR